MIIFLSLLIIVLLNTFLTSIGFGNVILHSFLNLILAIGIDAVVAILIRLIPEKKLNPFAKIFQISKGEKKFYEAIGVKKWKDLIPESGKYLAHFAKDKIEKPNDNKYVLKFLNETLYAGIMHIISIFAGFIPLVFMPYKLTIVLPIALVNAFLQILPVIVQRYNRVRLVTLYKYNERHKGENNE